MSDEDRYVMYLVIPTSLKMNMGKTAAAVGHAVQNLLSLYYLYSGSSAEEKIRMGHWLEDDWPSYAKVVLAADDVEFAEVARLEDKGITMVDVIDRGFSQVQKNARTCIGPWPMKKSEAPEIIKKLKPLR